MSRGEIARNVAIVAAGILAIRLFAGQPDSTITTEREPFGNDMFLFTTSVEPGLSLLPAKNKSRICVYGEMPFLGSNDGYSEDASYLAKRLAVDATQSNLTYISEHLSARSGQDMSELTLLDPVVVERVCSINDGSEITLQIENNIDK